MGYLAAPAMEVIWDLGAWIMSCKFFHLSLLSGTDAEVPESVGTNTSRSSF